MNIDSLAFLDFVRKTISVLPAVTEAPCYGTPGFYVNKKLLARLKEDGETLVVYSEEREVWMKSAPSIFFITEHYRNYPYVLVNLVKVKQKDLFKLLTEAWCARAGKKLLKEWESKK